MAAILVVPKLFGYKSYAVLSASMKPNYPTGSMVFAKSVDVNELSVGDVIVFEFTDTVPATHRIKKIVYNDDGSLKGFLTKGDNSSNEGYDQKEEAPLSPSKVIGRVDFGIFAVGYIISMVQRPVVYIPLIAILLITLFLPDIVEWLKKLCDGDSKADGQSENSSDDGEDTKS